MLLILNQLKQHILGQVALESVRLAALGRARRLLVRAAFAQKEWICDL